MKLILIEWLDSKRLSEGWEYTEDIEPSVVICQSVGWILRENKSCIVIMPHRDKNKTQGCGIISIPKCAIKSTYELKR
jgi:hypothetical protein